MAIEDILKEKPSYYAILPATIRYDETIIPNAKILYAEITSLTDKKGYCWANNGYFAQLYNVSKITVSKWISQLEKKGYIETNILYKESTKEVDSRYIKIIKYPISEKVNTYMRNDLYPISEIAKDNNTSINNIYIKKKYIKKKNKINDLKIYEERFEEFWKKYPKKRNKSKCLDWYLKNKPDEELHGQILLSIVFASSEDDWKKSNYQYAPYPSTFLNQKRWEDFKNE